MGVCAAGSACGTAPRSPGREGASKVNAAGPVPVAQRPASHRPVSPPAVPSLLAVLVVATGLAGCQQNVSSYKTLPDASAACHAWREKGRKLSLVSDQDPGDRADRPVMLTSSRACRFDSRRDVYVGLEVEATERNLTPSTLTQAQKPVREFRIER